MDVTWLVDSIGLYRLRPNLAFGYNTRSTRQTSRVARRDLAKMPTDKISELLKNRERLKLGGGLERAARQHNSGKLTARERVTLLLDRDSFQEAGLFAKHSGKFFGMVDKDLPADGVVTGRGRIGGRPVHIAPLPRMPPRHNGPTAARRCRRAFAR